jgi:hypothetical protein
MTSQRHEGLHLAKKGFHLIADERPVVAPRKLNEPGVGDPSGQVPAARDRSVDIAGPVKDEHGHSDHRQDVAAPDGPRPPRTSPPPAAPSGPSFVDLKGKATITGVGFFDEIHGQTEVAPKASSCTRCWRSQ